ncbi:iron-sulfur cluster insertion protein ErpA [Marinicella sp. S1101]|uniref:iron-sulfur cluster insertion protein ErpA n=1 Tax=Marinicella marina TaxID=2996016 RepID=UPI002260DE36|nr:iron-sulfur cluster insertion protein ErpA [Marinicella marina]MCX7552407.1 iron-sulfur cluster insertion protein ErpA [Marinicella marina]MDJ1139282.1 iron-sulfur cluster insertion protein ErpA [Marinicella marina]
MSSNQIHLSGAAANKINQLVLEEMNPDLKFRVYIIGGGCSGFQYGFAFEEEQTDGDMIMEEHGVQMMVDPMSFPYLMGSTVDFLEDLQGSRFVVSNPNAKSTCGCGSSFAI